MALNNTYSKSVVIRGVQIKTTVRQHFTPTRMVLIKIRCNSCWWGCGEIGTLIHSWWEYKHVQLLWEPVWQFLRKLNIDLLYDPAILLLGIYPKRNVNISPHKNLFTNVRSSFLCNSQKVETTQMSINS